jgi:hypothetical protein
MFKNTDMKYLQAVITARSTIMAHYNDDCYLDHFKIMVQNGNPDPVIIEDLDHAKFYVKFQRADLQSRHW